MRGTLVAITILLGRKTTRPYHTHMCVCAFLLTPVGLACTGKPYRSTTSDDVWPFDLFFFFPPGIRTWLERAGMCWEEIWGVLLVLWLVIDIDVESPPNMLHWNLFLREATKFRRKKKNVEQMSKWSRWNKSSVFQILGSADWGSPYDGFRSSLIPGRRLRVRALLPFPIRRWPLDLPPSLS
jgi:hypothetical protein